jgi:hypothetical protein
MATDAVNILVLAREMLEDKKLVRELILHGIKNAKEARLEDPFFWEVLPNSTSRFLRRSAIASFDETPGAYIRIPAYPGVAEASVAAIIGDDDGLIEQLLANTKKFLGLVMDNVRYGNA